MEPERIVDTIEVSAEALVGELRAVRDSVEELYLLLDHIWRNREELHDILSGLSEGKADGSEEDEAVACCQCSALQPSLVAAVRQGWTGFQLDEGGSEWNYLAICGDCQKKQADQDRQRAVLAAEMALTPEQAQQAAAEGVTTEVGMRRIEKNARSDEVPEIVVCARCDVDSPESLAAAIQEGWTNLCRDDGPDWHYLGICPECQAQEIAGNQEKHDEHKRLFG